MKTANKKVTAERLVRDALEKAKHFAFSCDNSIAHFAWERCKTKHPLIHLTFLLDTA